MSLDKSDELGALPLGMDEVDHRTPAAAGFSAILGTGLGRTTEDRPLERDLRFSLPEEMGVLRPTTTLPFSLGVDSGRGLRGFDAMILPPPPPRSLSRDDIIAREFRVRVRRARKRERGEGEEG